MAEDQRTTSESFTQFYQMNIDEGTLDNESFEHAVFLYAEVRLLLDLCKSPSYIIYSFILKIFMKYISLHELLWFSMAHVSAIREDWRGL